MPELLRLQSNSSTSLKPYSPDRQSWLPAAGRALAKRQLKHLSAWGIGSASSAPSTKL